MAARSYGGLSSAQAAELLQRFGPNVLRRERATPLWRVLLRQFEGALVWLLLGATVLSVVVGEVRDAIAIGAILLLNALVGVVQESRAERAVLALRSLTAPHARVRRDGQATMVAAAEVVPGDLMELEAGDIVAADAHLVEAHALKALEAALTGESTPAEKRASPAPPGAPLAERHDRVFMGTSIATGTAVAEVEATGMGTELWRIAALIATATESKTPLQVRLEQVGRTLLVLCLGVVVVVACVSALRGMRWLEVLMSATSLAVAAVPEGLAAMVTVALAMGVQRMAKRHVLVRRLPAVETLGSTTVICTDKTGTLTRGVMAVREVRGERAAVLEAAAACCDAELGEKGGVGDPTELALLAAARELGIERSELERVRPRLSELPFDSARKRMSVWRSDGVLYVKGAVESVVPLCDAGAEGALEANAEMASRGLRVLAIATGRVATEEHLQLLGLVGIADPPRPEATEAVARAREAGIRTVMITGDHPTTAAAIAREMGILAPGDDVREWVHARATPEEKLQLVRAWRERGAVVAMTGDGVNDAPALREADIGIAMGQTGTEVAREAADMVLADDNFASIVAAVQEGRGIFENIQKALVYLLAGNCSELLVMFGAAVLGMPLPLLPLQILWINLVTDGMPALALVMDPSSPDLLSAPPRPVSQPMLGRTQWSMIVLVGACESALALCLYALELRHGDVDRARDFAFTFLVFAEVLRAFPARSATRVFWRTGVRSNLFLVGVVALSIAAQIALHHLSFTRELFHLSLLPGSDRIALLVLGFVPATALELAKLLRRALARAPR